MIPTSFVIAVVVWIAAGIVAIVTKGRIRAIALLIGVLAAFVWIWART